MLVTTKAVSLQDLVLTDWQRIGAVAPGWNSAAGRRGVRYDKHRRIILGFMCRLHC